MKIYAVKVIDIENEKLNKLCSFISSDKKFRIQKFVNKIDKVRALIGELLIRKVINDEIGLFGDNIVFDRNQYGKPFLVNHEEFHFNISHSGDYVVCATDNKPIGIDIEEEHTIKFEEIAQSFFTEREIQYIIKEDSEPSLNRFYKIWTLKESFIKCCGQGLSIPLKSFSIEIINNGRVKVVAENRSNEYILKSFNIEDGYQMAVCSINSGISDKVLIIEQCHLIKQYDL